jgi:hypothetical protein
MYTERQEERNIVRVLFVIYYTDYGRKDRSRRPSHNYSKLFYVLAFFNIVLFCLRVKLAHVD